MIFLLAVPVVRKHYDVIVFHTSYYVVELILLQQLGEVNDKSRGNVEFIQPLFTG